MEKRMVRDLSLCIAVVVLCASCQIEEPTRTPVTREPLDVPAALTCVERAWNDDRSWQIWPSETVLPKMTYRELVSDGDLLWASTDRGLIRLDVRTWQCDLFTEISGWWLGWSHTVLPDGNGGLWIGVNYARRFVVFHLSDGRVQVAYRGQGGSVVAIRYNSKGALYLLVSTYCGFRCGGGLNVTYLVGDTFPLTDTGLLLCDADGVVECEQWRRRQPVKGLTYAGDWSTTEDGLIYTTYDRDGYPARQFLSLSVATFPGEARALTVDDSGSLWAVNGVGVLRYDDAGRAWRQVISTTHGADAIAADPVGGVWAAGRGEVVFFDGEQERRWPAPDVMTPTALLVDEGRRVWVGTLDDGIWMAEPLSRPAGGALDWRRFGIEDGLADVRITGLIQPPGMYMIAAHHAGISFFKPATEAADGGWDILAGSDPGGDSSWPNALAADQAWGGLWVGYYPGVTIRCHGRAFCRDLPGEEADGVNALLVDGSGTLWAGTAAGVYRLAAAVANDEPRWQMFDPRGGPQIGSVLALAQDGQGHIWAGGTDGVAVWERGQ